MSLLKRTASKLPWSVQQELKRLWFRRLIRSGRFTSDEPEFAMLPRLVAEGDWVIDIGANVGHYTKRLSELVGPSGRVIAIEPVPATFALLAANTQLFRYSNVTLLCAAASDSVQLAGMTVGRFSTGLENYYEARITRESSSDDLKVLTLPLDSLGILGRVRLIKIDAEGHEASVIRGLRSIIDRFQPTMIVEGSSADVESALSIQGYRWSKLPGSPNRVFSSITPSAT